MADRPTTIALVGHCGPDSFALQASIRGFIDGADVPMINDQQTLDSRLGELDVLLVNRVLDGGFPSEKGVELIKDVVGRGAAARCLLVSNFADAQAEAEQAGAMPGFGKAEMRAEATGAKIAAALEAARAATTGSA